MATDLVILVLPTTLSDLLLCTWVMSIAKGILRQLSLFSGWFWTASIKLTAWEEVSESTGKLSKSATSNSGRSEKTSAQNHKKINPTPLVQKLSTLPHPFSLVDADTP